ncbi:MAG: type II restriction endonuclease [Cloacibacillus sp.]
MKRDFDGWLTTLKKSLSTFQYYVDFGIVYENVDSIKIELNILNSLIGVENIEEKFRALVIQYPKVIQCIPILIAVRDKEIKIHTETQDLVFNFKKYQEDDVEKYCYFMRESGLFDLIQNHVIRDLVDYVTGVETGLDSNRRKNRGGHIMEDLVEGYLNAITPSKNCSVFKEMYISEIATKWGINLDTLSNNGTTEKRFDFVIKTSENLYLFETNFYTSSGSKLNETARSYKQIAQNIASIRNVHFIWITDGIGWVAAKHNLQDTFENLEHLYNINDLENGVLESVIE